MVGCRSLMLVRLHEQGLAMIEMNETVEKTCVFHFTLDVNRGSQAKRYVSIYFFSLTGGCH